jgi:hypothetical protein
MPENFSKCSSRLFKEQLVPSIRHLDSNSALPGTSAFGCLRDARTEKRTRHWNSSVAVQIDSLIRSFKSIRLYRRPYKII